ncbi:unnamed protein product [Spirodela intermedia]|uniref:Uncharacterized protein n=1 Tax=Spirodela intermedia TaxID=51605 RepID=A0A7I8KB64_SPIIN|nr:unnamed protein product [Spirodela intermedia]
MAPSVLPSLHTLAPPCVGCRSGTNGLILGGSWQGLVGVPGWNRCAPRRYIRVEAKASPRKESAKVRNRRLQKKQNGTPTKPRLSVFCSSSQLYAMLIDDQNKKTLFYASTLQKSIRGSPDCSTIDAAQRVGEVVIKACSELKISEISSYDRNGFARGERMRAFEIAIAEHGFLPR